MPIDNDDDEGGCVTARFIACALACAFAFSYTVREARSDQMKAASCSSIEMKYSGEGTATCYFYDDQGNQTETISQRIVIKTSTYEFVVSHTASKFRTYLLLQPVRNVITGQYFNDTDNWQPAEKYGGFELAAFNGYESSGSQPVLCVGFARFSGNPGNYEFDAGVGYKNLADGVYCAFSGQAALANPISNFYHIVEDALNKVTFPPN